MVETRIFKIYGRVQHVGFRYATNKKALELGICGFVKNMPDGSVYVEAQGSEEKLDAFMLWCKKGPAWAYVNQFITDIAMATVYENFSVR